MIMKNQDKFPDKIEELYSLQPNWDNRGAKEISALSIKNLILLNMELGVWDFETWQIAPGVNGDIFLNYKHGSAGIVINENSYSWFLECEDKLFGATELIFDTITVRDTMKKIEQRK